MIGGQACIIYGASEFSRDSDSVIPCNGENIKHLEEALAELMAGVIYVPPLEAEYLERGHACHFRCQAKDARDLRIDVMSKLRGCGPFDKLWERRKTIRLKSSGGIDVIGLEDLVQTKKTQRDKDWFMLRQLVENDIIVNEDNPSKEKISWWLLESRNADSLIKLAGKYSAIVEECIEKRELLKLALTSDAQKLNLALYEEELIERQKDVEYWKPLRKELETLRHNH